MLVGIVFVASILRLWQLGSIPPSPDWDEAALGYNAYSILLTGKDEYGKVLPVVLRSFDDYKPAFYVYLIVPLIKLFDLSTFTVRLPSAIFGVIAVVATFFLVQTIFDKHKYRDSLSLLAAFILAISPIALQVSRIAFESNVGMALNLLAALFFIRGLKNHKLIFLSVACAVLSIYTYQSEKVFTPLFMFVLVVIYWKNFFALPKRYIVGSIVFGIIIISPMLIFLTTNKAALLRAQATSILADKTGLLKQNVTRQTYDRQSGDKLGQVLDNRRFEYAKDFVAGYISHFDFNWAFINGDLKRHHAPNTALLYLWEIPFLLLGIYYLIFGEIETKTKLLVFSWFLIAPVPAAFTTGVPHALRTLNFLPTFQIFTAVGLLGAIHVGLKNKNKLRYLPILGAAIFIVFNFIFFLDQYYNQQNYFYAAEWQYGWQQAVDFVKPVEGKYDKIIVSTKEPLDEAHMFFAFYLKYPPLDYQKTAGQKSGGFGVERHYGKYEFRPVDWDKDSKLPNTLIVATPHEIPDTTATVETINDLNGSTVMRIASTK